MTGAPQVDSSQTEKFIVTTDSLSKVYGDFRALDGCSLKVHSGEVFGLLGPNGAGKTTLLRLLLGYLKPSGGHAQITGFDCDTQSVQVRQSVAYLPGDARLFRQMKGRAVLKFFAEVRATSDYQRSLELAERLELDLRRRVGYMSTGMRQKLALAATLAANTPLIILDEPTANLDPTVRATVITLVKEAQKAGKTVMFSSHVLSEIEDACDRVVILRGGKLVHTQCMADLAKLMKIVVRSEAPLSDVPNDLSGAMQITHPEEGETLIETDQKLAPILKWLANHDLQDVRIEPAGLRSIYERYHSEAGGPVS